MAILSIILTGIVATLAMTLFTELAFGILNRPYHVVRILGNMLRFESATPIHSKPFPELIFAGILHFAIGILFAFAYPSLAIWMHSWSLAAQAATYGTLIGLIGIGGWILFFNLHPGPPPVYLPIFLSIIGIGHLAFAFTLVGILASGALTI